MGTIRTLLAVTVVLAHMASFDRLSRIGFNGGAFMAVNLFFVISGFYMALVLDRKYRNDTLAFYRARALRLYPFYWVVLALTLLVAFFIVPDSRIVQPLMNGWTFLLSGEAVWLAPLAMISNLTFFGLDFDLLVCVDNAKGVLAWTGAPGCRSPITLSVVPQAWTLGTEVTFYVLIPFIFRAGWRGIIVCVLVGLISKALLFAFGTHNSPWDRAIFTVVLLYFMSGVVAYRVYASVRVPNIGRYWPVLAAVLGVVVLIYADRMSWFYYDPQRKIWLDLAVDPAMFLLFAVSTPVLFHASKSSRVDQFIGEFSYPIYIVHILALTISVELIQILPVQAAYARAAFHLAVVLILSGLGVGFVTLPIERIRPGFARRKPAGVIAAVAE